jgi:hypothetical protein
MKFTTATTIAALLAAANAFPCSWSGHCLGIFNFDLPSESDSSDSLIGDPCTNGDDCDGALVCNTGFCSEVCDWPGHCISNSAILLVF